MPLALVVLGVLFMVVGIRGTQTDLFNLLKGDFTGPGNFIYWVVAILIIGATGYIKPFKPVSDAFLVLVLLVMVLSNRGFFDRFMSQINSTTTVFNPGPITPLNPIGLGQGGLFGGGGASGNY